MKKIYFIVFLLLTTFVQSQNFDSFASGIKIRNTIFNTTGSGINLINPDAGAQNFEAASLGFFGQNSSCARITGGEVKTWKTNSGNVCSATLYWRVYTASNPTGLFNQIPLNSVNDCNTTTSIFNDGIGPCSPNDQKWKNYTIDIDFISGLLPGNYILEMYFEITGSDSSSSTCETTKAINNSGNNYKATFTITNPICDPVANPTTLCEGDTLTLTANPSNGEAPYSYAWTGPNGFISSDANPTITNITTSGSGIYSLIITDACGSVSIQENTEAVVVTQKTDPFFDALFFAICNGANPPILPNLSTNGITGTWNPPLVSNTATGNYIFTPDPGQCANSFTQPIFVINNVTPTFTLPTSICLGSTPPNLPSISNNGILGTWSPALVVNSPVGSYTYTFTPSAGQCALVRTITINVSPIINPTFTLPNYICHNASVPVLPTTSNNGISGTWNPITISSSTVGTFTFTFTPNNPIQCGNPTTISIEIRPILTPTFDPIDPICEGDTAPTLPTTSTNGVSGTWSPTVINNTISGTYTFTPNVNECAVPTTLDVIVNQKVTPTFDTIPDVCYLAIPPVLPTTSNNGISGTWSPTTISNTASGTYTFTPNSGECALPTTITVTITIINPIFSIPTNLCANQTAPILPTTSDNGITGVWNPNTINNTASGTYTFTPDAGQCATEVTISITIDPNITPTFDAIAPFCEGETAPILPSISNNGITGTWNPAVINNLASGNYTFTPDPSQCALEVTISVTVNPNITPTFAIDTQICENEIAPSLPLTSSNGITGIWSPSVVNNTTTGTYLFTPNPNQCALTTTITITVEPNITPTFDLIPPFCSGATAPLLPNTSTNGITGTWSPNTVSNTASGTYTFTPDPNQCALTTSISITVNPLITPTFDSLPQICYQGVVPALPTTSNNGITGTWNPNTVSNTTSGTYTFTPDAGQCATPFTVSTDVLIITPLFDPIAPICYGETAPTLPLTSLNGITGTWNPSTVSNTLSGTYTFTPNSGQCAIETTLNVIVNSIIPEFTINTTICFGSTTVTLLPTTSNNGIIGVWSPSIIDTTTAGTYTFTPDANQCSGPISITTTIQTITPTFDALFSICENSVAPILATLSNNGISGTWNPAIVSNTVSGIYTFTPDPNQCAITTTIEIIVNPLVTPSFDPIQPICYGTSAPTLPTTSNNGIIGTWSPSTISTTASGTYTFTPLPNSSGICANSTSIDVVVTIVNPIFDNFGPICFQTATIPDLPTTSNNGITGTWNPTTISTTTSGTYTFTPDPNQCAPITTISIDVTIITPNFEGLNPICENEVAPILPTTSANGIVGVWNPATIDNTISGTYTFTPNPEQCATVITVNFTVNPIINPTFDPIAAICYGSTPPSLPSLSTNGITGTWNPNTVSNTTSGSYTFTPDAGQCATTTSLLVTVTIVNPIFDAIAPFCENGIAPILATVSNNGITGTWSPSTVDTTISGTYTFTPDANQCATVTTLDVTVIPNNIPTFNPIADVCFGTINVPTLPTTSLNGITGTWNPIVVDNQNSGTYIFTPNVGQCSEPITITINVTTITPTFTAIPDVCFGSTIVPSLPLTSTNGITGTWNPPTIDNQNPGTYTFTPNPEQCAIVTTLSVGIFSVTPTFNPIPDVCYGSSTIPTLPTTSVNGISGTWSPSIISNTISNTYTFTPDAEQCATSASLSVNVSIMVPNFSITTTVCQNETAPILPLTSDNGITGTWNPSVIDNVSSGVYTFTPDAEQCAVLSTVSVVVTPKTTPTFSFGTSLTACEGDFSPQVLIQTTSQEGITGTWNPNTIDFSIVGVTVYTFTPNPNECAIGTTLSVTITPRATPTFAPIAAFCSGSQIPSLPNTSLNGYTGTWSPSIINNLTSGTYTFTPDANQCASITTMNIVVYPSPTDIDFNSIDVVNGNSTGTIEIIGVTNGSSPYLFSINNSSFTSTTLYTNLESGEYLITVRDSNGCEHTESITINSNCMFPNGISPNGDGKNDTFNLTDCNVVSLELYNRYGTKVNSFGSYTNQWDGTTSDGKTLPDGTYYYVAQISDGSVKTGWVYVNR